MTKKIDIPKLRSRILWTLAMSMIAVLFVMSVQRKLNANVENMVVKIKPIKGNRNLIGEGEVKQMVNKYIGFNIDNANLADLDVRGIEDIIRADKRVKKAEVFVDGKEKLNIWIVQKQPIVRVMDSGNKSYYLDEEGDQVPTVQRSAIRVPLATGNIDLYHKDLFKSNKCHKLNEVYAVSKYIFNDSLLSAMVEQIDVNENKEIVLIPKIGRHEIVLGDSTYLQEKFDNLKIMYKEGLGSEGWRKYNVLKLNYRGLVYGVRKENPNGEL